jgi:hypothetical protein
MADNLPEREDHDIQLPDLERPGAHHEATDINVWAVGKFAVALAFLCMVALGALVGLYKYLESENGGALPASGLNVNAGALPPEPRLQEAPATDLKEMRAAEDKLLHSYGWIDRERGIVRVPIDRAIDLLAQRGLPSRPGNGPQSAAADVSVPTESGLGPKMIVPGGPLAAELQNRPRQGARGTH